MKITPLNVTIRDLTDGYVDEAESGIFGYGNRLNIQPPYQRAFVYDNEKRAEVIRSVRAGMPLNVIYWAVGEPRFEMLDGQQRTTSICQYVNGDFAVDGRYFHNLTSDEQKQILDYELMVYLCDGTESEKLAWFRTINIAGEKLEDQELRNAVYSGPWVSDARRYFSKVNGPAYKVGKDYMSGEQKRQKWLETVIKWAARDAGVSIDEYMGMHQHDEKATELWEYFQKVMKWVKKLFKTSYTEMKSIDWGRLYSEHKNDTTFHKKDGTTADIDPDEIDKVVRELRADYDVTSKKGIYEFILTGDSKHLSIREFDKRDKKKVYERQGHKCPLCVLAAEQSGGSADDVDELPFEQMYGDHIIPWSKGGLSTIENLQMLCLTHNLAKSNKQ